MINKKNSGFTLIELLIVIAVMAILMSVVFVALNPMARFEDARNNTRWSSVEALIAAIKLHQVDNVGVYGEAVSDLTEDLYYQIGEDDEGNCSDICLNPSIDLEADCVDLDSFLSGNYLNEIPVDPSDENASYNETRYYIMKNGNGRITIGSCSEELGSHSVAPDISITR